MSKISYAQISELGNRAQNEDSYAIIKCRAGYVFVVADGLGGHGLGDVASGLVCSVLKKYYSRCREFTVEGIKEAYDLCQKALIEKQNKLKARGSMRTTLCLLLVGKDNVFISHIGDSRVYSYIDGTLKRTVDHSVPQMLALTGEIEESEIRYHEDRNKLYRVMGVEDQPPQSTEEPMIGTASGMKFILCSDGFWEMINEEEMIACMESTSSPDACIKKMFSYVHLNGEGKNADNTTAILVWL